MKLVATTNTTVRAASYTNNIAIVLGVIVFVAIALFIVFRIISNKYVKKNRRKYFDANQKICSTLKVKADFAAQFYIAYLNYVSYFGLNKTIRCSRSVVSGSMQNPLKYVMKYSNIDYSVDALESMDNIKRFFSSYDSFLSDIKKAGVRIRKTLPWFYRIFVSRRKLPYLICDIDRKVSNMEMPFITFLYVSPAGKSGSSNKITLNVEMLSLIVEDISGALDKKGHSKRQRSAMTNDLREAIKKRDDYTCCVCGNSVYKEPNLLLEVDHIVPVSKGGKTEASNLQTLCWRCNRKKGDKE